MKGCSSIVTVWRRKSNDGDNNTFKPFERQILPVLCFWTRRAGRNLNSGSGAGVSAQNNVSVIIPYISGFTLAPGDLIALGEHNVEITGMKPYRENDIKAALGNDIITVANVSYNIERRAEHLRVEGV